jgi:hypothetical protein
MHNHIPLSADVDQRTNTKFIFSELSSSKLSIDFTATSFVIGWHSEFANASYIYYPPFDGNGKDTNPKHSRAAIVPTNQ